MFDHLVESQTDTEDLKRKGAFLGVTLAIYGVLLIAALVASIIAVDAHLDSQNLELETLVAPVPIPPQEVKQVKEEAKPQKDQNVDVREQLIADMDRPDLAKDQKISTDEQKIPPVRKGVQTIQGNTSSNAAAPVAGPVGPGDGGGGTANQSTAIVTDDEPPPPKPTPKPVPKTISGGVLNGKAVSLPKPSYPQIARAAKASGTVVVQVTIDESGRVVSASAISGHPLLKAAAVQAAYGARFSPTLLSGQPVKVTGTINYNFMGQ